jgi:carbon monoxide dehydrogenase subunit G
MVELDHSFSTGKPADYNLDAILDLDRVIPCVEGGKVLERESADLAKAEIKVKMGAMSMTFKGTVEVASKDENGAVLRIKSRDTGGSGYANADVRFAIADGGGKIHTEAKITGKAASMGEGVVATVLDALIKDFTTKLAAI